MAGHLGVTTPGDPATPRVPDIGKHSSEAKLKQGATGCQIREARGNNVKIPKCSSSSNLKHKKCTLLQTAYRGPRRAGRESTSGFEFFFIKKTFQKHQELTQTMYPLSNQAPSPAIPHHVIVEELNLTCPGSSRTSHAPCPTETKHVRCRRQTQRTHQMASHEPFDVRSARMSWHSALAVFLGRESARNPFTRPASRPPPPGTGMSTFCLAIGRKNKKVGTSTNCSANCGSRTEVRGGMSSTKILGTPKTCSATGNSESRQRRTSTSCSPISGTGTSRDGKNGALSPICSTVCRWTSCGLTPARRLCRDPAAGTSSLGSGMLRNVAVYCSFPPPRPCPSSDLVRYGACTRTGP